MANTITDGVYTQSFADTFSPTAGTYEIDYLANDMTIGLLDFTAGLTITTGTANVYDLDQTTPAWTDISGSILTSSGTYDPAGAGNHLGTKSIAVGTNSAGRADFIAADFTWTGTTLNSDGLVIYDDTNAADALFCVIGFTQAQSSSGSFTVDFPAAGFIQITLTG